MKLIIKTGKPWTWVDSIRRNRLVIDFKEPSVGGIYIHEEQQLINNSIGPLPPDTPWEHHQSWLHLWLSSKLFEDLPEEKGKFWWYSDDEWDGEELRSLKLLWLRANWNSETFCRETWANIFRNKDWPLTHDMKTQKVIHSFLSKIVKFYDQNEAQSTVLSACFGFTRDKRPGKDATRILKEIPDLGDVLSVEECVDEQ